MNTVWSKSSVKERSDFNPQVQIPQFLVPRVSPGSFEGPPAVPTSQLEVKE